VAFWTIQVSIIEEVYSTVGANLPRAPPTAALAVLAAGHGGLNQELLVSRASSP
jgi:hypothetical protein